MKKRTMLRLTALVCALALCVCLAACGGSSRDSAAGASDNKSSSQTEPGAVENNMASQEYGYDGVTAESTSGSGGTLLPTDGRKVILNARLTIEALDFSATCSALIQAAKDAGGYVSSTDLYTPSYEGASRSARYQFRVPAKNYDKFIEGAGSAGNLVNKNESAEDVTSEYVDVEARLKSLKLQEERLYAMMEQAGELETLLAIQNQLTEVQYQIESYTARQRTFDDLIEYSTVDVDVEEVRQITVKAETFGERVSKAFTTSWSRFGRDIQDFAVWFVEALPALLVWAVLIGALVVILRAVSRRNAAHRARMPARPLYQPAEYGAPKKPAETKTDEPNTEGPTPKYK